MLPTSAPESVPGSAPGSAPDSSTAGRPAPEAPTGARHALVVGDSLTYHGPDRPHHLEDARLWPNVMAARLAARLAEASARSADAPAGTGPGGCGRPWQVDLVARLGWTSRDAWWAITKDPRLWGRVVPRAELLVLAVGGMDQLPAAVPTYLRDGIPYLRPARVRRAVRRAYRDWSPTVIRATGGRMRQLPQHATDRYLTRITQAARHFNPDIPVLLLAPSPWRSPAYPSSRHHTEAVAAAFRWGDQHDAAVIGVDDLIGPSLLDGSANPDGLHWSWVSHGLVGEAAAGAYLSLPGVH